MDNVVESGEIKGQPERGLLLESSARFAEYLTGRWPQTNDGRRITLEIDERGTKVELPKLPDSVTTTPRLNYYIAGSLGTMLLAQADTITDLDENLEVGQTMTIPVRTREILGSFVRQIGDLDYIPTDAYRKDPTGLKKGGGGPSFDEVPENARRVLKISEGSIKLMCDPLTEYGTKRIARVVVGGKDYYLARPDTMLGYKILHILQGYERKPERFNEDFGKLLEAIRNMYSDEELISTTYQILQDYEEAMRQSHNSAGWDKQYETRLPRFIRDTLSAPNLSPEIRTFIEKLKVKDSKGLLK